MPDRDRYDDERYDREQDRWPDHEGGDRGRQRRETSSDPGGYGGGRQRGERWPDHGFGDRGWGGGRGEGGGEGRSRANGPDYRYPEGVRNEGPDDDRWQERYERENRAKYGQWGGQPIVQRGAGQSMGGREHREQGLGSTRDVSARGGYGIRETERWPGQEGGRFAGKGPKNWRRPDDRINEDVCERLTDAPDVDATDIEVRVQEGEVTLSGTVDTRHAKRMAEDIASAVPGVRDVHNQIRVMNAIPGMRAGDPQRG